MQRAAESLAAMDCEVLVAGSEDLAPATKRRRAGYSSNSERRPVGAYNDDDDDDDVDDADNESVSSDKRESLTINVYYFFIKIAFTNRLDHDGHKP